ncbi:MAG: alpha/beta fold hydrolase [Actinobacteria bacterium]|nr:alpha/beta fold hydrolase [Actinomycetota bacterium]
MAATSVPEQLRLSWHRTTLDGRLAFYGEAGDGPPLVFLHGWGVTSRCYAGVLPLLASAGRRVIAPALPGFGESEDLPGQLTWEKLAKWVDDLLDHAGVDEPASLVGHSFGGGVATMTAWHHPRRAGSLVLINSVGGSAWSADRTLAERPLWDWALHLPREWVRKGYRRVLPAVARDIAENLIRHPGNLLRSGRLAVEADILEELADLSERGVPVTILWADGDQVLPEAAFVSLCEAAGGRGDVVPGSHSWLLADPEGFGEAITNSLAVHDLLTGTNGG